MSWRILLAVLCLPGLARSAGVVSSADVRGPSIAVPIIGAPGRPELDPAPSLSGSLRLDSRGLTAAAPPAVSASPSPTPIAAAPVLSVLAHAVIPPGAKVPPAPAAAPALRTVEGLRQAKVQNRLEDVLPRMFDTATRVQDLTPVEVTGPEASAATDPDTVRQDTVRFLSRLGFRDYPAIIAENLRQGGQDEDQKRSLEFNARRTQVLNAARDLAAEIMAGLAEQGHSRRSLENATELAARLLSLQPLDPPASLPPEVARQDEPAIRDWLAAVTEQRLSAQLAQVVSDAARTAIREEVLDVGLAALERGDPDSPAARELVARVQRIKDPVERILIHAYTDAETGQTRYAGRALAASLVLLARQEGRPELTAILRQKLAARGLYLENFVGDTLVLPDRLSATGITRLKLSHGDIIGERDPGLAAAAITFGVRPAGTLWFKALRQKILGNALGLWANPMAGPDLIAGQPLRNLVKGLLWDFRRWLAERRFLQTGYAHVGMASLEESDGVVMAWALDNFPQSDEGGLRKIGIAEEFALPGPFLRLGSARFDPDRVWDAFHAQAAAVGYQDTVSHAGGTSWPSVITREEYETLLAIPRSDSGRLLTELTRRASQTLEDMLARFGVGYSLFTSKSWHTYCSSALVLAYRMGGQFEIQSAFDHWHVLLRILKRVGVQAIRKYMFDDRIIWPGSLFIDPKLAQHNRIDYPTDSAAAPQSSPYTMPAYVEMDRKLTSRLQALVRLSDAGRVVDTIQRRTDQTARGLRRRGDSPWGTSAKGYFSSFERLWRGTVVTGPKS
jgi:hypothetical protein